MPKWMKPLLGILSVIIIVYVVSKIPPPSSKKEGSPTVPENVAKIEVMSPKKTFQFERKDDLWNVVAPIQAPANPHTIQIFLKSLENISLETTLTQREESHQLYDLDEEKAVKIFLWGEGQKEPQKWFFGKRTKGTDLLYMRMEKKPDVYLTSGVKPQDIKRPLDQWREKRILVRDDSSQVKRVKFVKKGETFEIIKSSNGWVLDGAEKTDLVSTHRVINELRTMTAHSFIDPPESENLKKYGLTSPTMSLEIGMENGKNEKLVFGNYIKEEDNYVLQRVGDPILYKLAKYRWNQINATKNELRPQNPTQTTEKAN